jgi:hypothetical protein
MNKYYEHPSAAEMIHFLWYLEVIKNINDITRPTGMFCRNCGGACDYWSCGMEQP